MASLTRTRRQLIVIAHYHTTYLQYCGASERHTMRAQHECALLEYDLEDGAAERHIIPCARNMNVHCLNTTWRTAQRKGHARARVECASLAMARCELWSSRTKYRVTSKQQPQHCINNLSLYDLCCTYFPINQCISVPCFLWLNG